MTSGIALLYQTVGAARAGQSEVICDGSDGAEGAVCRGTTSAVSADTEREKVMTASAGRG